MSSDQTRDERSKLKALIGELEERAANLSLFDKVYEVNTHCDDLVGQVTLAVQSAIERLNQYQAEMIEEVNNYRAGLLQTEAAKTDVELKEEVAKLSKEIETFRAKCADHLAEKKTDETVFKEAETIRQRAQELRRQLRSQAFNGGFLGLIEKDLTAKEAIGPLDSSSKDPEDHYSFKHFVLDEHISQVKEVSLKYNRNISGDVKALLHLHDGNIAFALEYPSSIHVMDLEANKILFELKLSNNNSSCTALAQLPSGHLVSGESAKHLKVWDLQTKQLVKVIGRADNMIIGLRMLTNGKLVALAGEIYVWDLSDPTFTNTPHVVLDTDYINWLQVRHYLLLEERNYLTSYLTIETEIREIAKHVETELTIGMNMQVLLDGKVAFCSMDPDGVSVQVWDPDTSKKVKETKMLGEDIESCTLLTNGDFILCRADQRVEIYSVKDFKMHHVFKNVKGPIVAIRQQTPRSLLFVHLNNPQLEEFYRPDSYMIEGENQVSSSCFLNDGKRLVIGSKSQQLVTWPLED